MSSEDSYCEACVVVLSDLKEARARIAALEAERLALARVVADDNVDLPGNFDKVVDLARRIVAEAEGGKRE